jgi:hypothetical protein
MQHPLSRPDAYADVPDTALLASPFDIFGCENGASWFRRRARSEETQSWLNCQRQWPKQGPTSYFPSIEQKYGRSIAEWQTIIVGWGLEKHMAIVGYLKSEHGMGHGHANALVGWTLAGNTAT